MPAMNQLYAFLILRAAIENIIIWTRISGLTGAESLNEWQNQDQSPGLSQCFPTKGNFDPSGTFDNVSRHFCINRGCVAGI